MWRHAEDPPSIPASAWEIQSSLDYKKNAKFWGVEQIWTDWARKDLVKRFFFSLMLEPLLDIMFSNCRHFMKVGVENDHRLIPVWWRNESSHGDDKLYNVHPREEFADNTCKHPPWCTIFTPSSSFNMKNQVVLAGWKRFFNPMA